MSQIALNFTTLLQSAHRLILYLRSNYYTFEADAAALVEHMGSWVGETLLALHGARTVWHAFDPAQFLTRLLAARTARTARTF